VHDKSGRDEKDSGSKVNGDLEVGSFPSSQFFNYPQSFAETHIQRCTKELLVKAEDLKQKNESIKDWEKHGLIESWQDANLKTCG
jgi:hypothetical protein